MAGFGFGQSLAYQEWIHMLLMRDAAMLRATANASTMDKEEEGSAMPAELQHRLESFLDLAEEAMSSKDKSADVTGDDDTEPQLRPSRHPPQPGRRGQAGPVSKQASGGAGMPTKPYAVSPTRAGDVHRPKMQSANGRLRGTCWLSPWMSEKRCLWRIASR